MSEDAGHPVGPASLLPPPPSLLVADVEHVALSERADPLDCGFVVAGGVLAPLPAKPRLPHEDDDELDDEDAVRG